MVSLHHLVSPARDELRSRHGFLLGWLHRPARRRYLLALPADVQSDARPPEEAEAGKGSEELAQTSQTHFPPTLSLTARGFFNAQTQAPLTRYKAKKLSKVLKFFGLIEKSNPMGLGALAETEFALIVVGVVFEDLA